MHDRITELLCVLLNTDTGFDLTSIGGGGVKTMSILTIICTHYLVSLFLNRFQCTRISRRFYDMKTRVNEPLQAFTQYLSEYIPILRKSKMSPL